MKKKKKEKFTILLATFVSISAISNLNAGMEDQDGEEIATSCLRWLVCANPSRQDKAEHFYQKGLRKKSDALKVIESGADFDAKKTSFRPLKCNNFMVEAMICLGVSKYLGHQEAGIEYEELLFSYVGEVNISKRDIGLGKISKMIKEKYFILDKVHTVFKSNINELSIATKVENERNDLNNYFNALKSSKEKGNENKVLKPKSPARRRSTPRSDRLLN